MKRLLRGGTVVSGDGQRVQDILIEDGKILEAGENLQAGGEGTEVTDVSGKLIFPGDQTYHRSQGHKRRRDRWP